MPSLFDYRPQEKQTTYHIKWTILKHIQYIINFAKVFDDEPNCQLSDEHFFDALSKDYSPLPAFGVDYLGKRIIESDAEDVYVIKFQGKNVAIEAYNKHGIQSTNRRLLMLHDILYYNFKNLSRNNSLVMYKFLTDELDPRNAQSEFEMRLIDSIMGVNPETQARTNSFEMTYQVCMNK